MPGFRPAKTAKATKKAKTTHAASHAASEAHKSHWGNQYEKHGAPSFHPGTPFQLSKAPAASQGNFFAPKQPILAGASGAKQGSLFDAKPAPPPPPKEKHFSGHPTVHGRGEKMPARPSKPTHEIPAGSSKGDVFYNKDGTPKVAKPAKTKAETFKAPHPDELTHVSSLGGSTGAKLMTDAKGNKYVVKRGANAGHIREESAADRLYEAMGVRVAKHTLHETADGPVKVSKHVADATEIGSLGSVEGVQAAHAKIREHFVADALLGNWDVVGANFDNILAHKNGNIYRIDNGGSLRYRAQGGMKADHQFTEEVNEIDTMRHGTNNASAKAVFGSLSDAEVAKQIGSIVKKKDKIVAAAPDDLKGIIGKRIDWLASKKTQLESKSKDEAIKAKADAKIQAKHAKKAAVHEAKVKKFQEENPGKKLPKSLSKNHDKPIEHFVDHSQHYTGTDYIHSPTIYNSDKTLKKQFAPWAQNLHPEEKSAIQDFSNSGYQEINGYIWGNKDKYDDHQVPEIKKKIELIDKALKSTEIHEPTVVYRGIKTDGLKAMGITSPSDLMPGQTIHMTGVKSTSIDIDAAKQFAGTGAVFKILADKGTKGAYINGNELSYHSSETEFTLPSTTKKFKVHSVSEFPKPSYHSGSWYGPTHVITLSIQDHG